MRSPEHRRFGLNRFRFDIESFQGTVMKRFNETIQEGAVMVDLAIASTFARELTEEQFGVHTETRPGEYTEERPVRRRGVVDRVVTRLARARG
jgi:hypothetical protein